MSKTLEQLFAEHVLNYVPWPNLMNFCNPNEKNVLSLTTT